SRAPEPEGVAAIDISRPLKDHLPRSRTTAGGVFRSLGLIALALLLATAVGVAGYLLVRLLAPEAPAFVGIPIGTVALVLVLRYIARRFAWIMPWYYLLPAIVFLLTFTFFPVVLTIGLAFTDYAGVRNGELNVSSETPIVAIDGERLQIANPGTLDCRSLRDGCNGVRAVVYASGEVTLPAESLDGTTLVLGEEPPAGRTVVGVELDMPDLGFAATLRVVEQDGPVLTLE